MSTQNRRKLPLSTRIGLYLFVWVLIVLLTSGIVIAAGGTTRPRFLGWFLTILGTAISILSIRWWARALASVFAPATLNGLIILIDGHALNQPSVPFPRWEALAVIALTAYGTIITAPFAERRLTRTEKIASVGILACLVAMFVGIELPIARWEVPVAVGLLICLAAIQIAQSTSASRRRRCKPIHPGP